MIHPKYEKAAQSATLNPAPAVYEKGAIEKKMTELDQLEEVSKEFVKSLAYINTRLENITYKLCGPFPASVKEDGQCAIPNGMLNSFRFTFGDIQEKLNDINNVINMLEGAI